MKLVIAKTGITYLDSETLGVDTFKESIKNLVAFSQMPNMDAKVSIIMDDESIVYNGMMSLLDTKEIF